MMDAADAVIGDRYGIVGESSLPSVKPYTWAYCKSSVTVPRWGILAIYGLDIVPTSQEEDTATKTFQDCPVLIGDQSTTASAWCVAVEPISAGSIGRVAVGGVVQCKAADLPKADGACVIWKNADWALIRIDSCVRLGTISGTWTKGNTATVTSQNGDGTAMTGSPAFTAMNYFATVTVSEGTKRVACAKVDNAWILIAAEC